MITEEIRSRRADGWPPVARITDPQPLAAGKYRVELLDARGEIVGEPVELQAVSREAAVQFVEAARRQLKR